MALVHIAMRRQVGPEKVPLADEISFEKCIVRLHLQPSTSGINIVNPSLHHDLIAKKHSSNLNRIRGRTTPYPPMGLADALQHNLTRHCRRPGPKRKVKLTCRECRVTEGIVEGDDDTTRADDKGSRHLVVV